MLGLCLHFCLGVMASRLYGGLLISRSLACGLHMGRMMLDFLTCEAEATMCNEYNVL